MKILIVIEHSPKQRFLVTLHTRQLVREVKGLIGRQRYSQAIATALFKGRFGREVLERELPGVRADMILSKDSASWDVTR